MKSKKNLWFSRPTQLLVNGQWWLIWNTQVPQTEQWWVLAGFNSLQIEHFLFQNPFKFAIVLVRYFINLLTSFWSPSNLSSSCCWLLGVPSLLIATLAAFLLSVFLTSSLNLSFAYRSFGLPGLMSVAQKWLNTILYTSDRPIEIHTSPKKTPSRFFKTTAITAK